MATSSYDRWRHASNGMLNSFEIQGRLQNLNRKEGHFEVRLVADDARRSIQFDMGKLIFPSRIAEGQDIVVNGYVRGRMDAGVRALSFKPINVGDGLDLSHLSGDALRDYKRRMKIGGDEPVGRLTNSEHRVERSNRRNSNYVGLVGFVDTLFLEKGTVRDDQTQTAPCLHILLRQFENPDLSIPVRLYGRSRDAALTIQRLLALKKSERRLMIEVHGEAYVKVKDVAARDGGGGATAVTEKVTRIIKLFNVRLPTPGNFLLPREVRVSGSDIPVLQDPYPWAEAYLGNQSPAVPGGEHPAGLDDLAQAPSTPASVPGDSAVSTAPV